MRIRKPLIYRSGIESDCDPGYFTPFFTVIPTLQIFRSAICNAVFYVLEFQFLLWTLNILVKFKRKEK